MDGGRREFEYFLKHENSYLELWDNENIVKEYVTRNLGHEGLRVTFIKAICCLI